MGRRGRRGLWCGRSATGSGGAGRLAVSGLDSREHQAREAGRDDGTRLSVGPARHRPTTDSIHRALSVCWSRVQPARALPVHGGGERDQRPYTGRRPRGVLGGAARAPCLDLQASSGRQVAERGPLEWPRARGRRRQVLLRGLREGGRAVVHLPRDRGHRDARQVHTAHPPQHSQRLLCPQPGRAGRDHLPPRGARGGRRPQEAHDRHRALSPQGATRKVRVVLARNPDYWDKGRPYVDEYVILSAPDAATRLAAFRSGQSDIIWVASPSEVETVRKTNSAAVVQAYPNTLAPFGLALAQDKPPFNDVRVRRAMSMAIDRQKQVDTVFEGHGIPGWGVPFIYYQDKMPTLAQLGPWVQHRPAEAKRLLTEAGHPNGFDTTLFYYEYFPQMTSQVQLVQQDLKKHLNINVKITKLDYTGYYGRYVESKWDGMAWGFQSGHAVGLDERTYHYLHSKSTKNFFRVNDAMIDDLTSKLRQTPDRAEQRVITRKIVEREFDQVWRMWMPYDNGFVTSQPHVRNMTSGALRRTDGYGSPMVARVWLDK